MRSQHSHSALTSQLDILWEKRKVLKKGGILLVNLLQSSRSTFSWGGFLRFFAFFEGMLDTKISAPGGWPTVPHEPRLSTAYGNRGAISRRIPHEFGTHHDP